MEDKKKETVEIKTLNKTVFFSFLILGKNSKQNLPSKRPLFTRWGRIETRARADGGKEEEEEKKKKKKKKKTMDPLPTTASLKRDVQWALLGSTTGRQSSVLEKRIQSAVDAVAFCACFSSSLPTREEEEEEDDDSDEEEEEEEELAKIETLAHFFYQCASVDLTPRGFDERLDVVCPPGGDDDDVNDDIVRSIPTETKRALRDAYVKNKTRLTRACRNLAEMEDEKTMERIEKVEWRMDVETSSRMRQNRGGGGGGAFKRKLRGGKESGRFRMLVRRAEKVERGGGEMLGEERGRQSETDSTVRETTDDLTSIGSIVAKRNKGDVER